MLCPCFDYSDGVFHLIEAKASFLIVPCKTYAETGTHPPPTIVELLLMIPFLQRSLVETSQTVAMRFYDSFPFDFGGCSIR